MELVQRLEMSLMHPVTYEMIKQVVAHNQETGCYETGGEFSLNGHLSFYDVPNKSFAIFNELVQGNYANIQNMIGIANSMRDMMLSDFKDTTDVSDLGTLIATLILLREGMVRKGDEEMKCLLSKYAKLFSGTYVLPESLTISDSVGFYHTHPFGFKEEARILGRDLTVNVPSIILEFGLSGFDGTVGLHFLPKSNDVHSYRIDVNRGTFSKLSPYTHPLAAHKPCNPPTFL